MNSARNNVFSVPVLLFTLVTAESALHEVSLPTEREQCKLDNALFWRTKRHLEASFSDCHWLSGWLVVSCCCSVAVAEILLWTPYTVQSGQPVAVFYKLMYLGAYYSREILILIIALPRYVSVNEKSAQLSLTVTETILSASDLGLSVCEPSTEPPT